VLRVILWLLLLAATLYVVFWVIDRRASGPDSGPDEPPKPTPRGPVGPDDDEDFLRELERRRRDGR
jgi:hypothetical protein